MKNAFTFTFPGTTTGLAAAVLTPNPTVACSIAVQVVLTSTGTVQILGSVDGTNTVALLATNLADGTTTASITASGIYRVDATGLRTLQPNVTANGSGVSITASQVDG